MPLFAILLLIAGGPLAIAALAVRFAGVTPVLSGLRTSAISDMAAFNRWAGNHLLVLPLIAFVFGGLGLHRPMCGPIGLMVLVVAGAIVLARIMLGAERVRAAGWPRLKATAPCWTRTSCRDGRTSICERALRLCGGLPDDWVRDGSARVRTD